MLMIDSDPIVPHMGVHDDASEETSRFTSVFNM